MGQAEATLKTQAEETVAKTQKPFAVITLRLFRTRNDEARTPLQQQPNQNQKLRSQGEHPRDKEKQ